MCNSGDYHPTLGRVWIAGNPDTCSKCAASIADDSVPLILFRDQGRKGFFAYCEQCEGTILPLLMGLTGGDSAA